MEGISVRNSFTLEERYTLAMEMLGYKRLEDPVDSLATLAFGSVGDDEDTIMVDGWRLLGAELEDMFNNKSGKLSALTDEEMDIFVDLIHPVGRIKYYIDYTVNEKEDLRSVQESNSFPNLKIAFKKYLEDFDKNTFFGFEMNGIKQLLCYFDNEKGAYVMPSVDTDVPLTWNERDEVNNAQKYIRSNLNKENMYHKMVEHLHDVLNECTVDVIRGGSEWGAWMGRVVVPSNPQDYLDIDVVGYSSIHKIICNLAVVHANEVVDQISCPFEIDLGNLELSMYEGTRKVVQSSAGFLYDAVNKMIVDNKHPMTFYSGKHLEEHYDILNSRGYDSFPVNDNGKRINDYELKDFVMKHYSGNDEFICTEKTAESLSECLKKMIDEGRMDNTEMAIAGVLNREITRQFVQSRQPNIMPVSSEVISSIKTYFETENGLNNYIPVQISRISNNPEDSYLYAVVGYNLTTKEYACWTSWNQDTCSLNFGHYNLSDITAALNIIKDRFNDITEEPDKYGMACTMIEVPENSERIHNKKDNMDVDTDYIRNQLRNMGIENGKLIDPEKLDRDPFIQQMENDVQNMSNKVVNFNNRRGR